MLFFQKHIKNGVKKIFTAILINTLFISNLFCELETVEKLNFRHPGPFGFAQDKLREGSCISSRFFGLRPQNNNLLGVFQRSQVQNFSYNSTLRSISAALSLHNFFNPINRMRLNETLFSSDHRYCIFNYIDNNDHYKHKIYDLRIRDSRTVLVRDGYADFCSSKNYYFVFSNDDSFVHLGYLSKDLKISNRFVNPYPGLFSKAEFAIFFSTGENYATVLMKKTIGRKGDSVDKLLVITKRLKDDQITFCRIFSGEKLNYCLSDNTNTVLKIQRNSKFPFEKYNLKTGGTIIPNKSLKIQEYFKSFGIDPDVSELQELCNNKIDNIYDISISGDGDYKCLIIDRPGRNRQLVLLDEKDNIIYKKDAVSDAVFSKNNRFLMYIRLGEKDSVDPYEICKYDLDARLLKDREIENCRVYQIMKDEGRILFVSLSMCCSEQNSGNNNPNVIEYDGTKKTPLCPVAGCANKSMRFIKIKFPKRKVYFLYRKLNNTVYTYIIYIKGEELVRIDLSTLDNSLLVRAKDGINCKQILTSPDMSFLAISCAKDDQRYIMVQNAISLDKVATLQRISGIENIGSFYIFNRRHWLGLVPSNAQEDVFFPLKDDELLLKSEKGFASNNIEQSFRIIELNKQILSAFSTAV